MAVTNQKPGEYDFKLTGRIAGYDGSEDIFGSYNPTDGTARIHNDGQQITMDKAEFLANTQFCPALARIRSMLSRTFLDASNDVDCPAEGESIRMDPNYAELLRLYSRNSTTPEKFRAAVRTALRDPRATISPDDVEISQADFDRLADSIFLEPDFRFTQKIEAPRLGMTA